MLGYQVIKFRVLGPTLEQLVAVAKEKGHGCNEAKKWQMVHVSSARIVANPKSKQFRVLESNKTQDFEIVLQEANIILRRKPALLIRAAAYFHVNKFQQALTKLEAILIWFPNDTFALGDPIVESLHCPMYIPPLKFSKKVFIEELIQGHAGNIYAMGEFDLRLEMIHEEISILRLWDFALRKLNRCDEALETVLNQILKHPDDPFELRDRAHQKRAIWSNNNRLHLVSLV
ncbi:10035_t:CDS:2, partial [Ambispora gerdemannii]